MSQPSASPSLIVHSTAVSFGTGSAPGKARHTGHVRVFGASPQTFSQLQNIFVRVFSWTWISRPMTASHSATEPLRDVVEGERALERVPDAEERVLRELRPDQLEPDREAVGEP